MESNPFDRPKEQAPVAPERVGAMGEMETLAFLQENGVQSLSNWQPHQPVLYVLEEFTRGENGPFAGMPPEKRPSIVRLDDPISINFNMPITEPDFPDRTIYKLKNDGGRVDYYVINRITKKPELVRSSNTKTPNYNVRKEELFMANDALFPKGEN